MSVALRLDWFIPVEGRAAAAEAVLSFPPPIHSRRRPINIRWNWPDLPNHLCRLLAFFVGAISTEAREGFLSCDKGEVRRREETQPGLVDVQAAALLLLLPQIGFFAADPFTRQHPHCELDKTSSWMFVFADFIMEWTKED